jgi:arsenate reductase
MAQTVKPSILFVCVANSCRSQMAEAFARALGGDNWEIWSAGSRPSGRLHPVAVQLMGERGIALTAHYSKGLDQVPARRWEYVVTMGCGDACPQVPARYRLDWQIPDPVSLSQDEARQVRDSIEHQVRELMSHAATHKEAS